MPAPLGRLERIVDASGVAQRIETLLPVGVRPRQLRVRTLLVGMLLAAVDGRPAHLRRVHQALLALPEPERRRLGVIVDCKHGPHPLTYRQTERTFALLARALAKHKPDGSPSELLSEVLDALLEASVQVAGEPHSSSYAVDWTDLEAWSRPPPKKGGECADGEALGAPPRRLTRRKGRDVLRLLPAGRDDRQRRARPRGRRARAPHLS